MHLHSIFRDTQPGCYSELTAAAQIVTLNFNFALDLCMYALLSSFQQQVFGLILAS